MFDFDSHRGRDSTKDLLAGWTPAEAEGDAVGPDSLLDLPQDNLGKGAAASYQVARLRLGSQRETDRDSQLFRAFQFEGETGLSVGDSSLSRGTRPAETELYFSGGDPPEPAAQVAADFPNPGEALGGFRVVSELGRGAFARVYLAEQSELGRRLVALKVSRAVGEEPQILARLQHTHIVPIFSVHDDPLTSLRLICMPYFGGANLAQVLDAAGARPTIPSQGRSLVEALDLVSQRLPTEARPLAGSVPPPSALDPSKKANPDSVATPADSASRQSRSIWRSMTLRKRHEPRPAPVFEENDLGHPARQFLRSANSIQAAVWIVARLAEGLDHAHTRGLVHRDLKPSNILIAADGTPMLLDFNLSTEIASHPVEAGTKALAGGTLPYMSPEHLDAFDPRGATSPHAVDERSDLYALGLILFEVIAGHSPFLEPPPSLPMLEIIRLMARQRRQPPSLRSVCPQVPWSLDAIVAQCLAPDPERRYARARDLAEDLNRWLEDLPSKHAPEPSLRERAAKWARRHPQMCSNTSIAVIATVLLLGVGAVAALLSNNNENLAARLKLQVFENVYDECRFLLNTTSGPSDHLKRGLALADRAIQDTRLGPNGDWGRDSWVRRRTLDEQTQVRDQTTELILLDARARVYLAGRQGSEADQRQALEWAVQWLGRAEKLAPHPLAALYSDRARYLGARGEAEEAARDRDRAARTPLATGRDYALRGTSLLTGGARGPAENDLRRAITIDPRDFWAWFALGVCHFEQGRYIEAAGDFGVCMALEPKFAWPALNRGLALAAAGRLTEALALYNRALELSPNFAEALVNRASASFLLNDLEGAERDLNRALELGHADTSTLAALGEVLSKRDRAGEAETLYARLLARRPDNVAVLVARGLRRLDHDPEGGRADLDRALELQPRNARALYAKARLLRPIDPHGARDALDKALDADPSLGDVVKLRALVRARLGDPRAVEDIDRLLQTPMPRRLYNAACSLALLAEKTDDARLVPRALAVLQQALDAGIPAHDAESDPDWQALCMRSEFREMIRKASAVQRERPRTAPKE